MMSINRTAVFTRDSLDFADCPPHPPAPTKKFSSRSPLFFSSLFSFFFNGPLRPRPRKRTFLSHRVLACKQHFAQRVDAFGVAQGGGRASSKLHAASLHPLQTYRAIRLKIAHPRPPLFLFFSLIQHGMARRMPPSPEIARALAASRKGAPVSECIPQLAKCIAELVARL